MTQYHGTMNGWLLQLKSGRKILEKTERDLEEKGYVRVSPDEWVSPELWEKDWAQNDFPKD